MGYGGAEVRTQTDLKTENVSVCRSVCFIRLRLQCLYRRSTFLLTSSARLGAAMLVRSLPMKDRKSLARENLLVSLMLHRFVRLGC